MTQKKEIPVGGDLIAEGKTKIILAAKQAPEKVLILSKDDITAGDGAKHDLIEGKAAHATRTTCNVFRLLKACGIPVAFEEQVDAKTFLAPRCQMLPYEVVVRREAHGSYLKRMPGLAKGHLFPRLLVEFFLKTSGRKWKEHGLLCDDPLMECPEGAIALYEPSKPIHGQKPFLILQENEVFSHAGEAKHFAEIQKIARRAFLILEKSWQLEGRTLVDFKVEFGLTKDGTLLLADVIDNDSWRVIENGAYIDKQAYRDGGKLDDVAEKYHRVAGITDRFRLPVQQVIIWRGSDQDDVAPVVQALDQLCGGSTAGCLLKLTASTCSIHKEPVRGLGELHRLVQQVPDTVVIAFIGRSNGAGPTLAASTTVPVITVPASFKDFPEDVWSSLRAPSNVPVTTVIEPANAAMAAIEILALRNPQFYMFLREQLEKRLVNTIPI
ncbi:MAG: phosphoribosylaminoimidazolesuccinocarboxamide synthase [Terrimicrobiaceae bacterium]|nr:AIR carboxylase family protein [Terrimicrobiaceae bacterium]